MLCQTFVMIVNSYTEIPFGIVLANDVLVEICLDFLWFRHFFQISCILFALFFPFGNWLGSCSEVFLDEVVCLAYTVGTDVTVDTGNQHGNLLFGTATHTATFFLTRHLPSVLCSCS